MAKATRARGRLITFEGGEGAGKTTQIGRLARRLSGGGVNALVTREPGGTPTANAIRALLVSQAAVTEADVALDLVDTLEAADRTKAGDEAAFNAYRALLQAPGADIAPLAEAMLHYSARVDHWVMAIEPMLKAGRWVLSDRFADSTMAYQGLAGGLGRKRIEAIHDAVLKGVRPDLTFVLDIDPAEGLERARVSRDETSRYEALDLDYHVAVRQAFLDIAKREPKRCVVIDAAAPPDEVEARVWEAVAPMAGAR